MKYIQLQKNIRKTLQVAALGLLVGFAASCSKDAKEKDVAPMEGSAVIKVNVKGVEEVVATAVASKNALLASNGKADAVQEDEVLIDFGGLDGFVSGEQDLVGYDKAEGNEAITKEDLTASLTAGKTIRPFVATTSPMPSGTKYRLIMINQNGDIVVNKEATAGVDPQIQVDGHRSYDWYAVSVGRTDGVPNIDGNKKLKASDLANKDVVFASGSLSTVDGDNYLDITMKRKTSRVQVEVNTRGMFSTIHNAAKFKLKDSSGDLITMGDLDIISGTFSNIQNFPNAAVAGSEMTDVDGNPDGTVKTASFYTLREGSVAANNLQIVMDKLEVAPDDAADRPGGRRTFAIKTLKYNGAIPLAVGSSYKTKVRLIESPIKVNGILWARGNLKYNSSATDKYRIRPNFGGSGEAEHNTEFWNWKATTPTGTVGQGDPCTMIYPANTWRMASVNEWESIEQPQSKDERSGLFFGFQVTYMWNKDSDYPSNTPAYEDEMHLSFGGYRTAPNFLGNTSVTGSPIGIFLGAYGNGTLNYWTSTEHNSNDAKAVTSSFTRALWLFSWTNVKYTNENKREGRNVRCVRNVEYNKPI